MVPALCWVQRRLSIKLCGTKYRLHSRIFWAETRTPSHPFLRPGYATCCPASLCGPGNCVNARLQHRPMSGRAAYCSHVWRAPGDGVEEQAEWASIGNGARAGTMFSAFPTASKSTVASLGQKPVRFCWCLLAAQPCNAPRPIHACSESCQLELCNTSWLWIAAVVSWLASHPFLQSIHSLLPAWLFKNA